MAYEHRQNRGQEVAGNFLTASKPGGGFEPAKKLGNRHHCSGAVEIIWMIRDLRRFGTAVCHQVFFTLLH